MQFFQQDNVAKFNKLKTESADVAIPFNAGRRTGFKANPTTNKVSLEDKVDSHFLNKGVTTILSRVEPENNLSAITLASSSLAYPALERRATQVLYTIVGGGISEVIEIPLINATEFSVSKLLGITIVYTEDAAGGTALTPEDTADIQNDSGDTELQFTFNDDLDIWPGDTNDLGDCFITTPGDSMTLFFSGENLSQASTRIVGDSFSFLLYDVNDGTLEGGEKLLITLFYETLTFPNWNTNL